jgi:hypothetical protein
MVEIFIGSVISILVEITKRIFGTEGYKTVAVLVLLALAGGFALQAVEYYGLTQSFLKVLVSAAGVWALIIKHGKIKD